MRRSGSSLAHVNHHLAARQFLDFAVQLQPEYVAVGDGRVQGIQRAGAGGVLDIDDLLFRFAERMRLEIAHLLQPVAVIACLCQQAFGRLIVQRLPPQAEEQCAVLETRHGLPHLGQEGLRRLVLGIGGKAQAGEIVDALRLAVERLQLADNIEKISFRYFRR